jgi:hypothetical protein
VRVREDEFIGEDNIIACIIDGIEYDVLAGSLHELKSADYHCLWVGMANLRGYSGIPIVQVA